MLLDEVRQVLTELAESLEAVRVSVEVQPPVLSAVPSMPTITRALGKDRHLIVTLEDDAELDGEAVMANDSAIGEAMERAVRALRTAARRWGDEPVPCAFWPETGQPPTHARVLARIKSYLDALAASDRCRNALITYRGELVASASPLTELDRERITFTQKQVEADAAARVGTSFGEIVGDDCYARSFWVEAAVIMFFDGPWALDFVRHRVRLVTREVGHMLPMLDPPPRAPAQSAPRPE